MAGAVGNFMFLATMIFIFTIILLAEYHVFRKSLVSMIPNKYFEIGLKLIFNIEKSVSSYLKRTVLSASSVAAMSIAGLIILNLAGANLTLIIFIGIIAGLSNLIPLIGPFVGMVPAILISFMNNIGNDASTAHMLFGVLPSPFLYLINFDVSCCSTNEEIYNAYLGRQKRWAASNASNDFSFNRRYFIGPAWYALCSACKWY